MLTSAFLFFGKWLFFGAGVCRWLVLVSSVVIAMLASASAKLFARANECFHFLWQVAIFFGAGAGRWLVLFCGAGKFRDAHNVGKC